MRIIRLCSPVAAVVREVADKLNGPDATPPKAISLPDDTVLMITDEPPTGTLLAHESRHGEQKRDLEPRWLPTWGPLGWIRKRIGETRFYAEYAEEYRKNGYWNNRFEIDARRASGEELAS